MKQSSLQLSRSIESLSKALSEWTVTRHAELDKGLAQRYGATWRERWVAEVKVRLSYLAQALAVDCPEVFSAAMSWSQTAFTSRGGERKELIDSLGCMRAVLESELPAVASAAALPAVESAIDALAASEHAPGAADDSRPVLAPLTLSFLEAVLDGRGEEAQEMVLAAVRAGRPLRECYEEVLAPAQAEIGRMWMLDEIGVADEHYATETVRATILRLHEHLPPTERKPKRAVATTACGDLHDMGARMVADCLLMDGWEIFFLGANTPNSDVVDMLNTRDAHLLAITIGSFLHVRAMGELIAAVRAADLSRDIQILVGGEALNRVPELWKSLGADAFASTAAEAVDVANTLIPAGSTE